MNKKSHKTRNALMISMAVAAPAAIMATMLVKHGYRPNQIQKNLKQAVNKAIDTTVDAVEDTAQKFTSAKK